MKFSELVSPDPKIYRLKTAAESGDIVHALLFTGPHGVGKKSAAELIARAALCKAAGERPCDVCPTCKKVLAGSHPDVHILEPEGRSIKIEAMRALLEKLSMSSYEGGRKIAVIRQADCMTDAAQNALLKTLEEPTGATLFFLITETPDALLPTIVSRCLRVRFHALETQDCVKALRLHDIDAERAEELAILSQGSVGRALEIGADKDYMSLRSRVIDALEKLLTPQDVPAAVVALGDVKGREYSVLEIMELWGRDLMRVQNGAEPLEARDKERLTSSKLDGSRLLRCLISARERLRANLSWPNVFEPMAHELVNKDIRNERNNTWLQS